MIARFMSEFPDVEVHLESTNRRVDVIREGSDLAIRGAFPPARGERPGDAGLGRQRAAPGRQSGSSRRAAARPPGPADLNTLPSWLPSGARRIANRTSGVSTAPTERRQCIRQTTTDHRRHGRTISVSPRCEVGVTQFPTMLVARIWRREPGRRDPRLGAEAGRHPRGVSSRGAASAPRYARSSIFSPPGTPEGGAGAQGLERTVTDEPSSAWTKSFTPPGNRP